MEDSLVCPLCIHYEPEVYGDYFVVAKCGHIFHNNCIMKILTRGITRCPLNCEIPLQANKLTKLFGLDPNSSPGNSRKSSVLTFTSSIPYYPAVTTHDYSFKIVLLGDSGVGKSCLMRRFSDNTFVENVNATRGVDLVRKSINLGGKIVQLIVWDTAGQETFYSIISTCVRDVQGIFFVYDTGNSRTLENIPNWVKFANEYGPKDTIRILLGNKADRTDRTVSDTFGQSTAEALGMPFIETSAKDSSNVDVAFRMVTSKILENEWIMRGLKEKEQLRSSTLRLEDNSNKGCGSFSDCSRWIRRHINEGLAAGLRFLSGD